MLAGNAWNVGKKSTTTFYQGPLRTSAFMSCLADTTDASFAVVLYISTTQGNEDSCPSCTLTLISSGGLHEGPLRMGHAAQKELPFDYH